MHCPNCGQSLLVHFPDPSNPARGTQPMANIGPRPIIKQNRLEGPALPSTTTVVIGECKEANDALLWAIVGFFCVGLIAGPMAIMKALAAKRIVRTTPGLSGIGKANAAIVIGIIDTGLGLGWLVKLMSWAYVMRGNADL